MSDGIDVINEKVRNESAFIETLVREIEKVIVGQRYLIDRLLIGLFANGHILVEGVPGLAKTLSIRTLAQAINAKFQRLQFTPDLRPADFTGTLIFNPRTAPSRPRRGRSSRTSSWPTRSTARRPRCRARFWRRCRNARSPSARRRTSSTTPSS